VVAIRKLTLADLHTLHEYSSDLENTYYMLSLPFHSITESEAFLRRCIERYESESPEYLSFAVTYGGVHVGEVFAFLSDGEADIGWVINKRYWRKGISTEAAKLLVKHLNENLNIRHFVAYCDRRNIPSRRVMERIGMTFAGVNGIRTYDKEVTPYEELKYELQL